MEDKELIDLMIAYNKLCKVCSRCSQHHCSACKLIYYCSEECQNKDWIRHKDVCIKRDTASKTSSYLKKTFFKVLSVNQDILSEVCKKLAIGTSKVIFVTLTIDLVEFLCSSFENGKLDETRNRLFDIINNGNTLTEEQFNSKSFHAYKLLYANVVARKDMAKYKINLLLFYMPLEKNENIEVYTLTNLMFWYAIE